MTTGELETWVKIIGGLIAAVGILVGGFKALAEWRRTTEQRKEELKQRQREFRHKQASFARELTREVFSDHRSRAALKMLDWLAAEYMDENGASYQIHRNELQSALRTSDFTFTDKEKFIRTRFEALYDYLEQIEHLIDLEVINFDDIETVFRYYMIRAIRPSIRHFEFLDYYDYPRAKSFLERFEDVQKQAEESTRNRST